MIEDVIINLEKEIKLQYEAARKIPKYQKVADEFVCKLGQGNRKEASKIAKRYIPLMFYTLAGLGFLISDAREIVIVDAMKTERRDYSTLLKFLPREAKSPGKAEGIRFIQDIRSGLIFGYPKCCILYYSIRHYFSSKSEEFWTHEIYGTNIRHKNDTGQEWIPCELCVLRGKAYNRWQD
jgi:hypothetical protein